MKVFVGYGYHPRDLWIEKMVFPLVKAFDAETVSGKELYGQQLGDGVKDLIKQCDVVIGFTTKRVDSDSGADSGTHRWVTDELATAHALGIPFVEVREKGITPQTGILTGRGYIEYEEARRAECLVEIATTVGGWITKYGKVEWSLMPAEFTQLVSPLLDDGNLKCSYQLIGPDDTEPTAPQECKIIKVQEELALRMRKVPAKSLVRILVRRGNDFSWQSTYQQVDKRLIHLQKTTSP